MSLDSRLQTLKTCVSSTCVILTDPDDTAFVEYMKRWSDINKQTPAAIVLPTSEVEIQQTVSLYQFHDMTWLISDIV